jgi:hypothetical protein
MGRKKKETGIELENEASEILEPTFKVKKNLGFENGVRSFFIDFRNIILFEGQPVSNEDYELFYKEAQEMLFEKI